MDASSIAGHLRAALPDADLEPLSGTDVPTLAVPRDRIVDVCRTLRDAPDLAYTFLSDLTCVDYWPRAPRFEVVYNLVCLGVKDFPRPGVDQPPKRLRLLVRLDGADARVPTLSGVHAAANWAEREVYDLFGIVFEGHPDLRRILMPDEWEGHPLRRDYPVQVKVPVSTSTALQLSEEEFVRNIERMRVHTGRSR
ncbi:MAG: NADH-quinone oxidoreductase subunit C [Vicinamibacterales bacterium]|nr:NADH-quinone oxidoreductase subunit C [Vicinamibacterales bacterium]